MATKKKNSKIAVKANCHDDSNVDHPDHSYVLPRLKRIQGQLNGIEKMIVDKRYCVDILIQLRAAIAAMRNLEVKVFETHLRNCVSDAVHCKDADEINKKVEELTQLLIRRNQL